jgi:hypothetical protein
LQIYSTHWTHRAVRLWFNNNKHSYLSLAQPQVPFIQPTLAPFPMLAQPITFAYPRPAPIPFPPPAQPPPAPETAYAPVSALLAELRRTPDGDERLPRQIADFDQSCQQLLAKLGAIKPEKIEPMLKYVRFPFPSDGSADYAAELMKDSVSLADLAVAAGRNVSFAQQLYAEDQGEGERDAGLWQVRPSQDTAIVNFECGFIGEEYAAFTNPGAGAGQTALTVWKYRRQNPDFTAFNFESAVSFEAMCLTASAAWFLSKTTLSIISFSRFDPPRSVNLPASGAGSLMPIMNRVAVAFAGSQSIYCVDLTANVNAIGLPFRGVACMVGITGHFLCGVTDSAVVRLVTLTGMEDRLFLGHCAPVTRLEKLSENTFASAAQDDTVRVWDLHDRAPLLTILFPHVAVTAMTGSTDHVICGFESKRIGVVNLTGERNAPVLGIHTQDLTPLKMVFDAQLDTLYMFAVRDADHRSSFSDGNRNKGKQTIFRQYPGFVRAAKPAKRQEMF